MTLPIISLAEFNTPESLAEPLRAACLESGFFYLVDYGVPQETIDAVFELSRRYFLDNSDDEKRSIGYDPAVGLVS